MSDLFANGPVAAPRAPMVIADIRHSTQVWSFIGFTPLPSGFGEQVAIVPVAALRALLGTVMTDETQCSRPVAGRSGNPGSDAVSELPPWQ